MKIEKTSTIDRCLFLKEIHLSPIILPALAAIASAGTVFYAALHLWNFFSATKSTSPKTISNLPLPSKTIPISIKNLTKEDQIRIREIQQKNPTENSSLYKGDLSWERTQIQSKLIEHKDLITYILSVQGNDKKAAQR